MLGKHRNLFVVEQLGKQPRHKRRLKVFLPVTIAFHGIKARAHVLDISKVGARLHASETPHINDALVLHYEAIIIEGIVVWVKGNGFGVLFDTNLNEVQIRTLLHGS